MNVYMCSGNNLLLFWVFCLLAGIKHVNIAIIVISLKDKL